LKKYVISVVLAVVLSLLLVLPVAAIPEEGKLPPDLTAGYFEGRCGILLLDSDGGRTVDRVGNIVLAAWETNDTYGGEVGAIGFATLLLWYRGADVMEDPPDLIFDFGETVRGYYGLWDDSARRSMPSLAIHLPYIPAIGEGDVDGDAFLTGSIRMTRGGEIHSFRGTLNLYITQYTTDNGSVPESMVIGSGRVNLRWYVTEELPEF